MENNSEQQFGKGLALLSFQTGIEAFDKKDYFVAYMNFQIAYENNPSISTGLMTLRSLIIPEIEKNTLDADETINDLIDDLTIEYPENVELFLLAIHYYTQKGDEFNLAKYLMQISENITSLNLTLTLEEEKLLFSYRANFLK